MGHVLDILATNVSRLTLATKLNFSFHKYNLEKKYLNGRKKK